MFHCTALFSGTHLVLPVLLLNLGESASLGTGTRMATLLAVERLLNWLRACRKPHRQTKAQSDAREGGGEDEEQRGFFFFCFWVAVADKRTHTEIHWGVCVINTKSSSVKGPGEWVRTQHFVCVCVRVLPSPWSPHDCERTSQSHFQSRWEASPVSGGERGDKVRDKVRGVSADGWRASWWLTSGERQRTGPSHSAKEKVKVRRVFSWLAWHQHGKSRALCVKNVHSMHTYINVASITSERKKGVKVRRKAIRSSSRSLLSSTLVCVDSDLFCDVVLTPCGQV